MISGEWLLFDGSIVSLRPGKNRDLQLMVKWFRLRPR